MSLVTIYIYTPGWRETMWGKISCLRKQHNGPFQKISVPYHGRLFGIPRARGPGFLELEIRRHGGILTSGILKAWGGVDLGFTQETDKNVFLESAFLWTF